MIYCVDWNDIYMDIGGRVAQSVLCLTADSGVASSISAWSHTFLEIDHEIISRAILPRHFPLIQDRLLSFTSEIMCTQYCLTT